MGLIPDKKQDKINFFQSKIAPWTTNASAIGVVASNVASLGTMTTAAQTALAAQIAAESTFRTSVITANNAIGSMVTAGSDLISAIRTKARTAGDGVYELAEIPPPATPSPSPAPGTPEKFAATLNANGSLMITWKCASPGGNVTYQIYRRATPTGEFAFLGSTGVKDFLDTTIPAGSSQVTYQVRAIRSMKAGLWAQYNVNFGAGGVVSSSEEKLTRKAA